MTKYRMYARGTWYTLDSKGRFAVDGIFSNTLKLTGISLRWNSRPIPWTIIKKELDTGKKIVGYVYDIDHGTHRAWGGSYNGKLPKAELYKI